MKIPAIAATTNRKLSAMSEVLRIFLFTFVIGLASHGFAYSNTTFGHDALYLYTADFALGMTWSRKLFEMFRGFLLMPWVIGLFTLVIVSLICFSLVRLLNVRHWPAQLLLVGIMVTYPAMTAFHNFFADLFTWSLLLSVWSVTLASRKGWVSWAGSIVLLTVSIGNYAAFISMAAALMVIVLLRDVLLGDGNLKPIILKGLKFLAILAISIALYVAIFSLIHAIEGNPAITEYRGKDQMLSIQPHLIPRWVRAAYIHVLKCLFAVNYLPAFSSWGGYPLWVRVLLFISIIVITGRMAVQLFRNGFFKKPLHIALCAVLLGLLPLAMNAIMVLERGKIPHGLMTYAYIAPFLLVIQYGEQLHEASARELHPKGKWLNVMLSAVCAACMALTGYYGFIAANANHLAFKLDYDASISLATRIMDRVQTTEGYTLETPVWFAGNIAGNPDANPREGFVQYYTSGQGQAMSFDQCTEWFMKFILSSGMNIIGSQPELDEAQVKVVKQLPTFPAMDCYTWIDNVLVFRVGKSWD